MSDLLSHFDPDNPIVSVNFNGMRATKEDGTSWTVNDMAPFQARLLDLTVNGHIHLANFKDPSGRDNLVPIPFGRSNNDEGDDSKGATALADLLETALADPSREAAATTDMVTAALAVYRIGKEFDVWKYASGAVTKSASKVTLSGGVSFGFLMAPESVSKSASDARYTLDVSDLLATAPTGMDGGDNYKIDSPIRIAIPANYWDDGDVQAMAAFTSGHGIARLAAPIDVKDLLSFNGSKKTESSIMESMSKETKGLSLTYGHLRDIMHVADFILSTRASGHEAVSARIGGTIQIGASISF